MILERIKQGYRNIPRKFGVHGSISLNHESIGGKVYSRVFMGYK